MIKPHSGNQPVVVVIDDDALLRDALGRLMRSVGLKVEVFASTREFLASELSAAAGCLVLDVRLPGLSGLDFQSELAEANIEIPIIFITGHGDIPMTVKAMRAGAVEFLTKPFRDQDLLDAVQIALERSRTRPKKAELASNVKAKFETLSSREQEVMALVTTGLMNKQVAAEIGIAVITAKVHRGHVMRKMGAKSLADLVRMADVLELRRPNSKNT